MLCPWCNHDNLPGLDLCANCIQDLTQLDRPIAQDRVERSLMDDPVSVLGVRAPVTLVPTAPVTSAIALMAERDIGAILIVDPAGTLVGILTERDLLLKMVDVPESKSRPIADFMTRRPETIRESDSLAFALHKMDCGGYRHLPVLRDGELVGIVSVRDVITHVTDICKGFWLTEGRVLPG